MSDLRRNQATTGNYAGMFLAARCLTFAIGATLLAGCGSSSDRSGSTNPTTTAAGLPTPAAAGPVNSYTGFQTGQQWSVTIDNSKSDFSYQGVASPQTTPATAAITASGSTKLVHGFLDLGRSAGVSNGYALELPGRSLMLRPGDSTTPLVIAAAEPPKCMTIGGGIEFEFLSMPNLVSAGQNDVQPPSYGTVATFSSGDGATLSFSGQTQYGLPPGTVTSGPYPSTFTAKCAVASGGAAITVPPTAAFPSLIETEIGPSGFFNLAYSYGASAGFLVSADPIDAKALTSKRFLGFMFTSIYDGATTVMPVSFGAQSSASGSIAGGEFPNDDLTQTPNAEYTLTLGEQSAATNGLYEAATLSIPLPPQGCLNPGTDSAGNPVCTSSAIAIAGYAEGMYSLYLIDGTTAFFLYQTNVDLPPPVTVAIAQSAPPFLYTGAAFDLSATVGNDPADAGVDWTASCGSAGACGTFSVKHTANGTATTYTAPATVPAGDTVTVQATSTTDQAKSASLALNIKAPIIVTLSPAPPATLLVSSKTFLTALVANDSTAQGVDWSIACGTPEGCGSLSLAHTASGAATVFTAPATPPPSGGGVTITATSTADATRKAAAAVTIAYPPVSIAFTPQPFPTQAIGLSQAITATVENDRGGQGVNWTVSCGSAGACGSFDPIHTASAAATIFQSPPEIPAGGAVTVTATSAVDTTKSVSATITITAKPVVSVVFAVTPPGSLEASATASLAANVSNDPGNQGVDWSVSCGSAACGSFSSVHTAGGVATTFKGPAAIPGGGSVIVTATATADPTKNAAATILITPRVESALAGKVIAGGHPVKGAQVSLYTVGTSGYASQANSLLTEQVTTDANGAFSIPSSYFCASPSEPIYLLSQGGDAGGGSNSAMTLMSALGACDSLSSSTLIQPSSLTVNEVTTVASVYALSAFMSSGTDIGASAANGQGIANAFAQVTNLVDLTQGSARAMTPAGNGTVPQGEIDTLANALAACAATNGSGGACTGLFSNATATGGVAPTDLVTAIWNISRNTAANVAAIYGLAPASGPYQPVLTTAPATWVMPVTYTGAGMIDANEVQIDSQGNVWTINIERNPAQDQGIPLIESVSKLSPTGVPLSPSATSKTAGGFTSSSLGLPFSLSIDPKDNVWTLNHGYSTEGPVQNNLTEFANDGTVLTPGGLQAGGLGFDDFFGAGLAIDGMGNLWVSTSTPSSVGDTLIKLDNTGFALSPGTGYSGGGIVVPTHIAIDGEQNVWVLNQPAAGLANFVEFKNDGTPISSSSGINPPNFHNTVSLAIDGENNIWASNSGVIPDNLLEISTAGTVLSPAKGFPSPANVNAIAIDGAGTLWLTATGPTLPYYGGAAAGVGVYQFNHGGSQISPPNGSYPALDGGVAIDGSGNVWVTNRYGGTSDSSGTYYGDPLLQLVGAATPVVTPLSTAAGKGMVANRP